MNDEAPVPALVPTIPWVADRQSGPFMAKAPWHPQSCREAAGMNGHGLPNAGPVSPTPWRVCNGDPPGRAARHCAREIEAARGPVDLRQMEPRTGERDR